MKNLLTASAFIFSLIIGARSSQAQVPTANSFSSQVNYTGAYRFGVNMGYYPGWSAENTATIATGKTSIGVKGVGVKSFRIPLYDDFLKYWGVDVEVGKFNAYASLGAGDHAVFVGNPDAAHRDMTVYPGSPEPSKSFKNLYEPIWLDAAQTQINPANYYAKYLYDVVRTYGSYVKFWEVMNEPDFTYGPGGWSDAWMTRNPTPEELVNLRAPFFHYVRMLRISWEVIKRLQPDDFVCVGGIGYRGFLDAILRNTDNPTDGSVTTAFPLKGGAYFDMISYHSYPMYDLSVGNRNSDKAANAYIALKNSLDNVAAQHGYNGAQFPRKQYICTETGLSRFTSGANWGSNEGQLNYAIKAAVYSMKNAVRQVYWFSLGDGTDGNNQHERMGLYNYFGGTTPYNQTPTDQGKAMKTTSDLLYGKAFDAARTAALALPANVDGAAFRASNGSYTYVLWAKTSGDMNEAASATYSFPAAVVSSAQVSRMNWDFGYSNAVSSVLKTGISLNGTPSFFQETGTGTVTNLPPVANAGPDQTITLPLSTATLTGTATDADGNIVSQSWSQISGPSTATILSALQGTTPLSGLIAGVYSFEFKATDNGGATGRDTVRITVNPLLSPPPSGGTTSRIEAESYTAMQGVQREGTSDVGGGENVGYIDNGDWMDYNVNVSAAGNYTVNLRLATPSGGQLQIRNASGSVLATVNIPNTGGYQNWQTVSTSIALASGNQTIRVVSTSNGWNFNWLEVAGASGTTPTPPPPTGGSTTRIEAENYTAMQGVQKENTSDAGGGENVSYIDNGDWMDYSVSVASAGSYTLRLRVASPSGGSIQIRNASGSVLATVSVPATGGWQNWQSVTASVALTSGTQSLRVYSAFNGWNFNWMEVEGGSATPPPPSGGGTLRIEAESYAAMSGVVKEGTSDAGGGEAVGYIDNGDWMDYNVNVSAAGSYTVNLRVASPVGSQLQIRSASGSVLSTVELPATGGWQSWRTVAASITLPQGAQTIRIQASANGWNFNWMELSSATGTVSTRTMSSAAEVTESVPTAAGLSIFPNPISDRFQLSINNTITGAVSVKVFDAQGAVQKVFSLTKTEAGAAQYYLSLGTLATGNYIIQVSMNGWNESKQIIKK